MRRIISIVLAAALMIAGLSLLVTQILNGSFYGAVLILGGFLTAVGAGWLYSDLTQE